MLSSRLLALACLLGAEAFGPPAFGSPMRARRIAMTAAAGASPSVGLGLGSRVLLGQDGPLLLRKAGISADKYAPEPPYGTHGLHAPVSCVLQRHRAACPAGLTQYTYQPRAVPCLPRTVAPQAGTDEPAQLTASAALLGVATACMGTAYARLLKAAVTLTWKTGPALLPPSVDPTLFVPAVCTLGGALVGLLAVNLPSTTMPDFIGTQNGQLSLPGLRRLGRVLLLSP